MSKFSYTYHPYNGAILAGDKTEIDARHINHNSNVIASVTHDKSQTTKNVMVAKDQNITQLFTATESKTSIHTPELIATVNALKSMQGQNRFTASFNNTLVADANRDNIKHMQMIKLITRMLGFPEMYFHLHNLFTENDVPQLEARQSLQDVFEQQGPIGRYARTPDSDLQFAEIKYDLKKYPIRIPTPIEDIFRTLLNPHEAKINQITWARGKRHNTEALTQLLKIETTKNMAKIDKLEAGDFHSENSTVGELNDIISDHLATHDSMLTHVGMGTKMFRKLVENTWTYNVAGPRPNRVIQGVYEFPGIDGTTVVVDPMLDANVNTKNAMFVIDKQNGAQYGQGPVLSKVYEDNERDAHVTKNIEFFEYLVVDGSNVIVNNDVSFDRKFALKINVAQ